MSGNQMILLGGSQAPAVDPFFYSVTSLLHGDGTNGGQNNTFLDSSTNNFTITRNGNTTQGSFSPFSQTGWGGYFDGSGDFLNFTKQTTTGSFTCECWFYRGEDQTNYHIVFGGSSASVGVDNNQMIVQNDGAVRLTLNATAIISASGTGSVAKNQWNHIAWVRSGTSCAIFVNGNRVGTGTSNAAVNIDRIGSLGGVGAGYDAIGYISNARITTTAVYDPSLTTCTVPTAPLTAVTGTYLLTLQSNRFVDNSASPLTITVNGNTSIQPFSPFNPTTAYSTSAVGGSGYFDGSGDFLSVANSALLNLASTFSLEFWIYRTASNNQIFVSRGGGAANWSLTDGLQYGCFIESSTFYFQFNSGGSPVSLFATATLPPLNAWSHVAIARNGTTMRGWLNGVSLGTSTSTPSIPTTTNLTYLGNGVQVTLPFTGYMAGVRLIQGSSAYDASSSTITVPTAPVEAITNTSLLCNFTNGAIFDNAADADYETVGNAQISTSVKKYGTGSIAFDGTGDYLLTRDSPNLTLGAGDFTVETWVYPTASPSQPIIVGQWDGVGGGTGLSWVLLLSNDSNRYLRFALSTNGSGVLTDSVSSTALALNAWNHVALVRCGSVFIAYLNGTSVVRYTISAGTALYDATNQVSVGSSSTGTQNFNGYIDDLRISKGICRYPYNFTPPTAEFPNIGGTVTLTADPYFDYTTLLLPGNGTNGAQNNTFLDSSTNAFSITRNGNTTQGTFSPFSQTGWGNYFDGSGDYLSVADNAALDLGTGDFTIEGWVYIADGIADNAGIVSKRNASAFNAGDYRVSYRTGTSKITFADDTVNERATPVVQKNSWVHFAIVRESGTISAYANGVRGDTAADTVNLGNADVQTIGVNATIFFTGYISNVRIVKGTAVYSGATYTIPTAPLTAVTNTSLLTCQSNRFIDNSTNNFAITRNGDVSVQAFSPFNPTAAWSAATNGGSGYFDGSGDYLTLSGNPTLTTNFTIEFWFYMPSWGDRVFLSQGGGAASFSTSNGVAFQIYSTSTTFYAQWSNGAGSFAEINTATSGIATNAWHHVAIGNNGTTTRVWIDGVSVGTNTGTPTWGYPATRSTYIGYISYASSYVGFGYMAGVRMVTSDVYGAGNTTITVPTAPPTAIANTQLLCNFTNAGIYDATSKNDLETVGNAQISTTQSKFGGSSMYFDGSGDYLLGPWNPLTDLGAGDFTIEFWMYPTAVGQSSVTYLFNLSTSGAFGPILIGQAASGYGIVLYSSSTGSSWNLASGSSFGTATANAWNHVALTRYGADVRLFLNGVVGTTLNWGTTALLTGSTYRTNIGSATGVANTFYTGYIDDLRVTRGIARYTSNFTPPTTAFLTL